MRSMTRREALKAIGLFGGVALVSGCTPVRIGLGLFPTKFKEDDNLVRPVLAALADTIVPGSGLDEASLCRPFYDDRFPLAEYRGFLASDLCQRAWIEGRQRRFDQLGLAARVRVVESALKSDGTTRKLYTGAIFLTQIAFYTGFYGDVGCPTIDFAGRYQPVPAASRTYPDPETWLAEPAGIGGNCA